MDWFITLLIGLTFGWTFNQQCEINRLKEELENIKYKTDINKVN